MSVVFRRPTVREVPSGGVGFRRSGFQYGEGSSGHGLLTSYILVFPGRKNRGLVEIPGQLRRYQGRSIKKRETVGDVVMTRLFVVKVDF